jgi:type II restriction/modification system DNA methylase subunit YeeA
MNKKALKDFAVYARKELMNQIALRAQSFGITEKSTPSIVTGSDYVEVNEKKYPIYSKRGIEKLINEIKAKGYENVIEEVAYTWFNRLIAIRYMEVHNYLPSKVRVLSSATKGKVDPDILTEYQYIDLPINQEEIESLLAQGNREEAYRKLLVAQCNELSEIMPFLFEKLADFTEFLLPESLLHADSLINKLGKDIEDENFQQVEVIGWLYQYYISEKKDEVFEGLRKNKKITKENIPAATQLFTPHWIVRYMVENSLGQLWLEAHPDSNLKTELKYYVTPAEQEREVQAKLEELRNPNLSPEEITILDPACGSGHILVYAFDILFKIYEERGYPAKEIPVLILEKNLYGIDIDDRAAQLTSFALMMKAREKTKKVFRNVPQLNCFAIQESNGININQAAQLIGDSANETKDMENVLSGFLNAKNFGSILQPDMVDFDEFMSKVKKLDESSEVTLENFEVYGDLHRIENLLFQAKMLTSRFDVVVTNPPYMGSGGMNPELQKFVKKHYSNSKSDLFSVFMERCNIFTKKNGFSAAINQHAWMFLNSYELLRRDVISNFTLYSMLHLGPRAFEEIGGEIVQSTSFILRKLPLNDYKGSFFRLVDFNKPKEKENAFRTKQNLYILSQKNFESIPGIPFAYWASTTVRNLFKNNPKLGELAEPRQGLATADNNRFLRRWFEVDYLKIGLGYANSLQAAESKKKWFPINKGGSFRKWYGNEDYIINWENDGKEIKNFKAAVIRNPSYYFKEGITWSKVSSSNFSIRYSSIGFLFSDAGMKLFSEDHLFYFLGLMNSKVFGLLINQLSSTMNFEQGNISRIPVVFNLTIMDEVNSLVQSCVDKSTSDWDSFEISWGYRKHPFLLYTDKSFTLKECFEKWEVHTDELFTQMKLDEEKLNKLFIHLYGLHDELTPTVPIEEVTIHRADRLREAKSFLSYCIGLMMGRYSWETEGLVYAGGEWDERKYQTFQPDRDGIIPLTDTEYFEDDVISRLQDLLVLIFGQENLAENLRWLAESLTMKANETPVERLRRYFFDEFYSDHCKIYQKRPIYWLAESGTKKGFRALFYLHRYTPETLATMRFTYVQNLQEKLRQEQKRLEQDLLNPELTSAMKKRYDKQLSTISAQQVELIEFDKKLAELANQRISLDLDDGVVMNYAQLQSVLAKIK